MPNKAKLYIASVLTAGLATEAAAVWQWQCSDGAHYLVYLLLALLTSTLKVSLPGIQGNISVNFLFVLLGVAELSFSETVVMAPLAALVQSVWRPKRRPLPVQVVFNMATLAISAAVAYGLSHSVFQAGHNDCLPVLLAVAACSYFLANTVLVTTVLCLVQQKPHIKVWRQCYLWSLPYYLVGALIAAVMSLSSQAAGWKVSLFVLPMMYLVFYYYKLYVDRSTALRSGSY